MHSSEAIHTEHAYTVIRARERERQSYLPVPTLAIQSYLPVPTLAIHSIC